MSNETISTTSFAATRILYLDKTRADPNKLKSTNKIRLRPDKIEAHKNIERLEPSLQTDHSVADAVFAKRVDNADAARGSMPQGSSYIETGKLIVNSGGKRAMNCGELSCVACFYAFDTCNDKTLIARASLKAPGDHVFCLIGKSADSLDGIAVSELAKSSLDSWVVDAWLNVCCAIGDYPKRAKEQIESWTSYGKRVYWKDESSKEGWWVPKGKYGDTFLQCALEITSAG